MVLENQKINQQNSHQVQTPESLARQIAQLRLQIEQGLTRHSHSGLDSGLEVHCDYPLAGIHPVLIVLSRLASPAENGVANNVTTVPWALDIAADISVTDISAADISVDAAEQKGIRDQQRQGQNIQQQGAQRLSAMQQQAQAYAREGVAECWLLDIANVELRIYRDLSSTGYRQRSLVHEGATISPLAFPQLKLTVQEPLPLFFLTRTTTGQKTYPAKMLPLRLSSF